MATRSVISRSLQELASYWLLPPRRFSNFRTDDAERHRPTPALDYPTSQPLLTSAKRAREIELLIAESVLDAFRSGAVRR